MMSHFPSTGSNRKDDGFRISDAAVERAIQDVMSAPQKGRTRRLMPMVSLAASIALILGRRGVQRGDRRALRHVCVSIGGHVR